MYDQNKANLAFRQMYEQQPEGAVRFRHLLFLKYSGFKLIDKILPSEKVLDVGCGRNYFKDKLPNNYFVGIDPCTDEADIQVSLQDYQTSDQFDVVMCLASIQYGDINDIRSHINKISSLLAPGGRIYWRCNPYINQQIPALEGKGFEWSYELHYQLAAEMGYQVVDIQDEYINPDMPESKKIFAEWRKTFL